MSHITKQIFFQLLNLDLSVKDFEQWVYKYSDILETDLQAELHFDLISFDYNQRGSFSKIKEKIKPYIDNDEFNIWRAKKLLTDIIEQKIDLVEATRKLRELYFDTGESFIPVKLGIGYESELDDLPIPSEYHQWDSRMLKEKLKKVDLYKDKLIRDAKQFLATLDKE
ncbi:MAG: hypothetical protein ABI723_05070 [Bacteroidia bacterium]